jgi:hypothetical protein
MCHAHLDASRTRSPIAESSRKERQLNTSCNPQGSGKEEQEGRQPTMRERLELSEAALAADSKRRQLADFRAAHF